MPGGRKMAVLRQEWNSEENKDVVILHMFPRSPRAPSFSPYVLKLETFLRMHSIKYKVDTECPMSPKTSKCPWITFNSEDVTDSHEIMEFLMDKLSLTPKHNVEANPRDKVLIRGLRSIVEDHFNFCVISKRMIHGNYEEVAPYFPTMVNVKVVQKFIVQRIIKNIGNQAKQQGIGRLPKETVLKMANADLETLSLALGEKTFFMGDEASEIDCTIFPFLLLYLDDFSGKPRSDETQKEEEGTDKNEKGEGASANKIEEAEEPIKYENLRAYIPRMKAKFWSDWDDLCKEAEEALAAKKEKSSKSKDKEEANDKSAKEGGEGDAVAASNEQKTDEGKTDKEK